jgi:cardiolipin synthase
MLQNGEEAFPAMLKAIRNANRFVYLSTYIFETNRTGRAFIAALTEAVHRGIDVKVILDGIGELYALPRAGKLLGKNKVRFTRFLPPRLYPPAIHINLRNHRKLMVVDGEIAFVGGMNIGDRHLVEKTDNPFRVRDVHFRLQGPIVNQLEASFIEDWGFCTGEILSLSGTTCSVAGTAVCRAITEGPNQDLDKLTTILVGAVSQARKRVTIVTPYFLPFRDMISALQIAALKGVEVTVVLPGKNNLPYLHWATRKMLWELLKKGVKVLYQPPPFVHSKLFVIDDFYALIGSANIDPRSLRLNFELGVEIFDREVIQEINDHIDQMIALSKGVTLEEMDSRTLTIRTRDALAWLFTPYL